MSTTQEVNQILHKLIDAWPLDNEHPTLIQAREYLETQRVSFGEKYPYLVEYTDDNNSMWYSL